MRKVGNLRMAYWLVKTIFSSLCGSRNQGIRSSAISNRGISDAIMNSPLNSHEWLVSSLCACSLHTPGGEGSSIWAKTCCSADGPASVSGASINAWEKQTNIMDHRYQIPNAGPEIHNFALFFLKFSTECKHHSGDLGCLMPDLSALFAAAPHIDLDRRIKFTGRKNSAR